MPVNALYKLHSIEFNDDLHATPIVIGSMADVGMPTDSEVVREVNAGNIYAEHSHTSFRASMINMTTWNLAEIFRILGTAGFCINTTDPQTGVHVYVARYDCNQIAASGHVRYTVRKGMVYPTSMTVDHQQNCRTGFTVMGVYDGTNEPLVKTEGVALPTIGAGDVKDRWTMTEKDTVRGVALVQKKSINIDFGAQTNTEGGDSEMFDSWASLDQVLPSTRFLGINPNWWAAAGPVTSIAGSRVLHANTTMFFRKREVADNVAEHVRIDTGGTAILNDAFQSTGNEAGRTDLRIDAIQDGANIPLVIQVDQAIP